MTAGLILPSAVPKNASFRWWGGIPSNFGPSSDKIPVADEEAGSSRQSIRVYGSGIRREKWSRREEVVLAQVRAGHCPSTKYYQKRFGIAEEAKCDDCSEEEGKDHVWDCAAHRRLREETLGSAGGGAEIASGKEGVALRYLRKVKPLWFQ